MFLASLFFAKDFYKKNYKKLWLLFALQLGIVTVISILTEAVFGTLFPITSALAVVTFLAPLKFGLYQSLIDLKSGEETHSAVTLFHFFSKPSYFLRAFNLAVFSVMVPTLVQILGSNFQYTVNAAGAEAGLADALGFLLCLAAQFFCGIFLFLAPYVFLYSPKKGIMSVLGSSVKKACKPFINILAYYALSLFVAQIISMLGFSVTYSISNALQIESLWARSYLMNGIIYVLQIFIIPFITLVGLGLAQFILGKMQYAVGRKEANEKTVSASTAQQALAEETEPPFEEEETAKEDLTDKEE
ncbi:MAG: hypothetical protein PHG02_04360 [Oscillospiraceae bacterium]|nr:hypothetical protein [Oscillospiraceae bacterium]